jgi:hypothetical protein
MSRLPEQSGPTDETGTPPPLYPPAAVPAPQEGLDADEEPTGAPLPDAAEEAGLPKAWPVLPPVD